MSSRLLAGLVVLVGLASCSDGESPDGLSGTSTTAGVTITTAAPPRAAFGSAAIEPAVAAAGDRVTVTPSAEIQPICGALAVVLTADERHDPVLQLSDGHVTLYGGETMVTWPACLPPRSAARATFAIAADFPLGTYVVCLTSQITDEGCATLTVVDGDGSVTFRSVSDSDRPGRLCEYRKPSVRNQGYGFHDSEGSR